MSTDTASSSITLQSGTFTNNADSGAFARVIDTSNGTTTIDSTRTTTSGLSSSSQVVITTNPDGSTTRETTTTNAQGGMTSSDITVAAAQNGVQVVTGTVTQADGSVDQLNGGLFPTSTGFSEYALLTSPTGQTSTTTASFVHSASGNSMTVDGTGLDGMPIDLQSTSTILSSVPGPTDLVAGYTPAAGAAFTTTPDISGAGSAGITPTTPPDLLSSGANTF